MEKIHSLAHLVRVLQTAKIGGQFVTLYAETDIKLNKFPTDGSERVRISDAFKPTQRFYVNYQFGVDYESKMSKALGEDYTKGANTNVETLVPNLLMRYKSTNNPCLIYMDGNKYSLGKFNDGQPYTIEDEETEKRYKSKASSKPLAVEYRTISVKNVSKLVANHKVYEIEITDFSYEPNMAMASVVASV